MHNNQNFLDKLNTIHNLLIEAYNHYFSYETYCKASEATVSLHFPNYWDLRAGNREPSVEIYSYVLSDERVNYFNTIDEALDQVKIWHEKEMSKNISYIDNDYAENEEYNTKFAKI